MKRMMLVGAAGAVLLMLWLATTASAERIILEPAGTVTIASLGLLTMTAAETISIACHVQMIGTLTREEINLTSGTQFGSLTSGRVESCSGGTFELLAPSRETPLRLTYTSFAGTLPDAVTSIRYEVHELAGQTTVLGVRCLYRGNIEDSAAFEIAEDDKYNVNLSTIASSELRKSSGSELCPATATMSGSFSLSARQQAQVGPRIVWTPVGEFESVRVGMSRSRFVTLRNMTGALVEVRDITKRGSGCNSFSFNGTQLAERDRILNMETQTIEMTFRPEGTGSKVCDLELRSMGGRTYVYAMGGIGI